MKGFVVVLLLLLQCACCVHSARHCRIDRGVNNVVSSAGYIVEPTSQNWPQRDSSSGCCAETYGFIPCSASLVGNLLLLAGYGYLMFVSGSLLTNGCELLLSLLGPGIIGGLILPIVASFSHAAPILVSGLSRSKEIAQAQVHIGMGLIAGSTVFLLTILWGACLVVGKCDFSKESAAIDQQDTKGFDLFDNNEGVEDGTLNYEETCSKVTTDEEALENIFSTWSVEEFRYFFALILWQQISKQIEDCNELKSEVEAQSLKDTDKL